MRAEARGLLEALLITSAWTQSIDIDWSRVHVEADGAAASFGPRVDIREDDAPNMKAMFDEHGHLGFYANADGLYGRVDHVEYLIIRRGDERRLVAQKIVGDANVPRGQLSLRSAPHELESAASWKIPVQLRVRGDIHDPRGFSWTPGHTHEIVWNDAALDSFEIVGQEGGVHLFTRVDEAVALEAARTVEDAP